MRKAMVSILAYCLLVPMLNSQEKQLSDQYKTEGFFNGRYWKTLSNTQKATFTFGYYDGLMFASGLAMTISEGRPVKNNTIEKEFRLNLNYGERMDVVDSFYKEAANMPLPIVVAFRYVSKKANGATSKELEEFMANGRKVYAEESK